mmetsp:Transcript_69551/g.137628  ORF Transcript_69551/g.137628 Transcript_69551/m.137628 type:complete len:293 (+) Transcript_69551:81-959(+)
MHINTYPKETVDELVASLRAELLGQLGSLRDELHNSFEHKLQGKEDKHTSYAKRDIDLKHDTKEDKGVAYTKEEVNALLANKEDKERVAFVKDVLEVKISKKEDAGVAYSRKEADDLLSAKEDQGVAYTKEELQQKLDEAPYVRNELDQMFAAKADAGTCYTKGEFDTFDVWTPVSFNKPLLHVEDFEFELPPAVADQACSILVSVVLRSGNEGPNSWYHLDVWTYDGPEGTNRKRIRGWHYPNQHAIAFNSETWQFAVGGRYGRSLHFKWDNLRPSRNWHGGEFMILGFRC